MLRFLSERHIGYTNKQRLINDKVLNKWAPVKEVKQ